MRNKTISLAEPITELRHIPIRENGDKMVDFLERCPELILDRPRFHYTREKTIREPIADALCQAARSLPKGYRLAIVEGWRPLHIQRRMYMGIWNRFREKYPEWSDVKLRRVVNRFTAPVTDKRVPPPHSTGGAVDLFLVNEQGDPYDFTSPYDRFDQHCYAFDVPGLSADALRNRAILATALAPTILTNYPSEYWHWSYGDQGWAYRGGHPYALYGPIEPENWVPTAEDVNDEPLRLIGT